MEAMLITSLPASPASSQVIFSLTPLWSALMAFLLLGDDGMGPLAWAGGAAVVAAGIMAAQANAPEIQAPAVAAAAEQSSSGKK